MILEPQTANSKPIEQLQVENYRLIKLLYEVGICPFCSHEIVIKLPDEVPDRKIMFECHCPNGLGEWKTDLPVVAGLRLSLNLATKRFVELRLAIKTSPEKVPAILAKSISLPAHLDVPPNTIGFHT